MAWAFVLVFSGFVLLTSDFSPSQGSKMQDKRWQTIDQTIVQTFGSDLASAQTRYEALFRYFVTGFIYYRTADYAHAAYPGAPSRHGKQIDDIEGFTRIVPLISAWIASGRNATFTTFDGRVVDLIEVVKAGLTSGTDPRSPGYWGHPQNFDQRICEASDVALSLWLLRESVWRQLDARQRQNVISWLLEASGRRVTDNNWHLFPVLINKVVQSLGYPIDERLVADHYARLKSFYRGGGWFSDGPGDIYDYYCAWGIHYSLFWVDLIDPLFDPQFISSSLAEFTATYKYFFSPSGIPITGRSVCYRMAAPAPLVMEASKSLGTVSPGMARHALDITWKYFLGRGAVSGGNVTQGYCTADLRVLDNYSGPASCLWALRSLVVLFYSSPDSELWASAPEKVPVEQSDFEIQIPGIGWDVKGFKTRQEVQIIKRDGYYHGVQEIEDYTLLHRLAERLTGRPFRPRNDLAKYRAKLYSSLHPFCGCLK